MLSGMGEIFFSMLVSYMGALEFFFVIKHLYHWSFQHQRALELSNDNGESLKRLQEQIKQSISVASEKEIYGLKAMKDGVLYKDGFRVDLDQLNLAASCRELIGSSRTSLEHDNTDCDSKDNMGNIDYHEKPFIKEDINHIASAISVVDDVDAKDQINKTVKTQFGQTTSPEFSINSEQPKIIFGRSEDSSSNDPISSKKTSSLSAQHSSSLDTTISMPELNIEEYERQDPDGQDVPEQQYSDDYLRSLDGIKHRPLVREDGTRRRRAFKKRGSSDSTSSRESRASREEELKMFTSLEEEEFEAIKRGDTDYTPIRYSSEPNLKVGKHHRRHKKSPVKDSRHDVDENRSSLEMLDEEDNNPWGDIKPEHYKDSEFWKREKEDDNSPQHKTRSTAGPAKNISKMSSFEEATDSQNKAAARSVLKQQNSHELDEEKHKNNIDDGDHTIDGINVSTEEHIGAKIGSPIIAKSNSASPEKQISNETDNAIACENTSLNLGQTGMRRSPKLFDMDLVQDDENGEAEISAEDIMNFPNVKSNCMSNKFDSENFLGSERRQTDMSESFNLNKDKREEPPISPTQDQNKHEDTALFLETEIKDSSSFEMHKSLSPSSGQIKNEILMDSERKLSSSPFKLEDSLNDENEELDKPLSEHISKISEEADDAESNAPEIAIEYASDRSPDKEDTNDSYEELEEVNDREGLLEGISDFYDFNASANPSRSQSVGRHLKSKSPAVYSRPSSQTSKIDLKKSPTPERIPVIKQMAPDLSDFYDFNVALNKSAYDSTIYRAREAHRDSIQYFEEKFKNNSFTKKDFEQSQTEIIVSSLDLETMSNDQNYEKSFSAYDSNQSSSSTHLQFHETTSLTSLPETPSTPGYSRSFSATERDIEYLTSEYRTKKFKKSTYVGESMDFDDDFEELREQTRHFRRSRSQSRSIIEEEEEDKTHEGETSSRRILQEKILEEIAKTTINYQEFSRDMNKEFLDYERRGSDSALIGKNEILFQLQDDERGGEDFDMDMNDLEGEEYHHFRRFSINQEYPVEEYPDDDYIYVEEIQVRREDSTSEWKYEDNYDQKEKSPDQLETSISIETAHISADKTELDDLDTGSEDERQTIVEVGDEIDEDIWEYGRTDEENERNDQFEGDLEEQYINRHENKTNDDWREEGAVGGDDMVEIEQIYDDAVKNTEESGIQRDYDNIVESIKGEENIRDITSLRTDDLLEEILREDHEHYKWSPKDNRIDSRQSTRSFLENEHDTENIKTIPPTTSTRLRSRYGITSNSGPCTSYENADGDYPVENSYIPKKEYNWRKNFKLDEDDETLTKSKNSRKLSFDIDESQIETREKSSQDYLDIRKMSLGGESITLYSRTPDRILDFEGINENPSDSELIETEKMLEISENNENQLIELENDDKEIEVIEKVEEVKKIKKKKIIRKHRKSSKASIEDNNNDIDEDTDYLESDKNLKKKLKKKRKSKDVERGSDSESLKISNFSANNNEDQAKTDQAELNINSKIDTSAGLQNPITPENTKPKLPETSNFTEPTTSTNSTKITSEPCETAQPKTKPPLERQESSGAYELIKDGSMYPWF